MKSAKQSVSYRIDVDQMSCSLKIISIRVISPTQTITNPTSRKSRPHENITPETRFSMLSRTAKSFAPTSRTAQSLAKYLEQQISTFWHKPRVPTPRPAVAKPRSRCHKSTNFFCSHCNYDRELECAFGKPITVDEGLYLAIIIGAFVGSLFIIDTSVEKYRLLKKAKYECNRKVEHEKRITSMEMKGDSLCLSEVQNHRVDRVDSEIMKLGKWAWILKRATEMEKELKGKIKL